MRTRGFITLLLTAKCNLSCVYCYENKDERRMSFEKAKEIIDNYISKNNFDEYVIDFFGGEPFIEFKLIKDIYEYVKSTYQQKINSFTITTNGTLVHGEIKKWLSNHNDVICTLSLDGTPHSHNINRSNSFEKIDINFFLKSYPDEEIKMTISPKTVRYLAENVIYCHNLGFKINCNLAFTSGWMDSCVEVFKEELIKLLRFYITYPDIIPCSLIGKSISNCSYYYEKKIFPSWCGVGNVVTFDSTGRQYPCQYFAFNSKGYDDVVSVISDNKITQNILPPSCQTCAIYSICPTCYAYGYQQFGNCFHKSDSYCKMMKVLMKCRSMYYYELHKLRRINLFAEENVNLLNTIILIQEKLV